MPPGAAENDVRGESVLLVPLSALLGGWLLHCQLILGLNDERARMGIHLTQVTTRCRILGNGQDYPRNLAEFEARFANEQACREYLCQLRWSEGFRFAARSAHDKTLTVLTVLLQCASRGRQASATAGTRGFQDTRKPLQSWFRAIVVAQQPEERCQRTGPCDERWLLGSYKTALDSGCTKLRRAMVRPVRDRLSGRVEVDETYLGALEEGVRGRQY